MADTRPRSLTGLLFLLTLALALRVVWVGLVPNEQVADFATYDAMAQSFLHGHGYTDSLGRPSAFKPPGWPLALAAIYRITGESAFAAKVIQANLSTLLCLLIFLVARHLYDERRAFVALTLAALHPAFVYSVTLLGTETSFAVLSMSAIFVLTGLPPGSDPGWWRPALAGLCMGAAGLMRPMALLFPAAVAVWLLVDRRPWKPSLRALAVITLCMALPVAPWTLRNWHAFGRLVPVSTNGGGNLLYGNNDGDFMVWVPHERLAALPGFPPPAAWEAMDEPARSSALQRMAWNTIRRDPAGFFARWPEKFYLLMISPDVPALYWNVEGLPDDRRPASSTLTTLASLERIFSWGLLSLAALGLLRDGSEDPRRALVYAVMGIWTLFHLVYWGKPRFRFPMIPLMVVLAAGPLAALSASLRRR
jgi:4-amino-4-deoxy-L-arabinose transferase-like glycosyltransferase